MADGSLYLAKIGGREVEGNALVCMRQGLIIKSGGVFYNEVVQTVSFFVSDDRLFL